MTYKHHTASSSMMILNRRQALIKLLVVLLFAVACLNFFIAHNDSGSGDGDALSIALRESSSININTDEITIEAGHLNGDLYLPPALRPSKDKDRLRTNMNKSSKDDKHQNPWCCLIASAPNKPKRITCHGTCFHPRACTDELYPFQSSAEQSFFRQLRNVTFENRRIVGRVVVGSEALELQRKCREGNARLHPPYQWCYQWLRQRHDGSNRRRDDTNYSIDPYEANLPPAGCSLIPGTHSAYQNLLLFPSASSQYDETSNSHSDETNHNNKLAFCGIPKNGITNWIQLLRFIIGAPDYLSLPYEKHDWKKFQFDSLNEHVQLDILNDESFTFAAFLRDPAERLLSLYLDKINGKHDRWKKHFVSRYGLVGTPTFEEFVKMIDRNRTTPCPLVQGRTNVITLGGVDWCTDEHWKPQTFHCGLSEFLPRFKFIGSLHRIEQQAKQILQYVGLWESYGRYYHEEKGFVHQSSCAVPPPELKVGDTLSGFQQQQRRAIDKDKRVTTKEQDTMKFAHHSTQSQSKLDEYYTEELRAIVKRLYANDYKVWNLIKDEEELVSGRELAMKLSSSCSDEAILH